jgi:glycosyltransferase involved in cell wall biosynthesis
MSYRATVCQLLHGLWVGGAELLAANLARRLAGEYRWCFACLDELGPLGEQLRGEGFPVHLLGRRPGLDARCVLRLASLLRRERVDVLHAHQYTPFFYAVAARLLCRRPPVLFQEHGRHQPDYPRRKRMAFNRTFLEKRDRVVAVGQAVRRALIANEGLPPERVAVIYNGVNLAPFLNGRPDRPAVRKELGVGPDDLVVIQVARLDYLKDHATAVRTLAAVRRSRPDARLVLVGDGPERGPVEGLVAQLGLGAHVIFLGMRADVPRLLAAADLFLLTSVSEGIPLTVIEAMAAGLPVVATAVGGLGEVIEHGRSGFLAPARDADTLAGPVVRLAGNPELRRQVGRAGRERAQAEFSDARMLAGYRALYEEMRRARR